MEENKSRFLANPQEWHALVAEFSPSLHSPGMLRMLHDDR